MTRTRLRNSLVISAVGFLLGWIITQPIFSAWHDAIKIAGPPPSATLPPASGPAYQTYAMVWVDNAQNPQPTVQAVWLAWVPSDYSTIEMIGLPPRAFQNQYSQSFKGLSPDSVRLQTRGTFVGSLILDQNHLKALVDKLGGIYLMGQKLNGEAVVQYALSDPNLPPDEALVRQGAVMQSLLAQLAISGKNLDLPVLLSIPQTNVDRELLLDLVRHYYPFRLEAVQLRAQPLAIGEVQP
jgi:hypothetical protein